MGQDLTTEFNTIQTAGGMALLPQRALLRVSGADSTRWLNGMVTNSVTALEPGQGAYSFFLNAQGRIQGDATIYREPATFGPDSLETGSADGASLLISTTGAQVDLLQPWLDRYIIMDEVELTRPLDGDLSLLLVGPALEAILRSLDLPLPGPLRMLLADSSDGPVTLFTPASAPDEQPAGQKPGLQIELRASAATLRTLQLRLAEDGLVDLSPEALEAWRVLHGTPLFGQDIRDRDLPQETGQTQALHFAKGCYLGQEIVERIRSRGQVHRIFTLLELTGTTPETLPAALEANGKSAGEITSAALVPTAQGHATLALGYVRREALIAPGGLSYAGGIAAPRNPPA